MSVLLVAALLAATASVVAAGCVAYILVSFRGSGHLLASRAKRQPVALLCVADERARRRQSQAARAASRQQVGIRPAISS